MGQRQPSQGAQGFANLGLSMTSKPWGMTALKTLLAKWAPGVCKTSVDQLGWTDRDRSAVVLGGGRVIGALDVMLMRDNLPHVAAEIREPGTRRVAQPCRRALHRQSGPDACLFPGVHRTAVWLPRP